MELMQTVQTMSALSGLICLTIMLVAGKNYLKRYFRQMQV